MEDPGPKLFVFTFFWSCLRLFECTFCSFFLVFFDGFLALTTFLLKNVKGVLLLEFLMSTQVSFCECFVSHRVLSLLLGVVCCYFWHLGVVCLLDCLPHQSREAGEGEVS